MLIEKILAAMLTLASPGVTDASRVQLPDDCDRDCVAYWDRHETAPRNDAEWMRAQFPGPTRRETRGEAIERWTVIASAIASVAEHPPEVWTGTTEELWRALVTIARHESAYWRSVHDGTLRGLAREVCLLQVHPANFGRWGIPEDGAELVGLDLEATTRCIRAGAALLARARDACGSEGPDWFDSAIVLYGLGTGCNVTEPWVTARVRTYHRTGRARPLAFDARLALMY